MFYSYFIKNYILITKILKNLDKEKIFDILIKNTKKLRKLQVKNIGLFG